MTESGSDPTITRSGFRLVGEKARALFRSEAEEAIPVGSPQHALYGSVFTAAARRGQEKPTTAILAVLSEALRESYKREVGPLVRDEPASLPASAYTGFIWDTDYHEGDWTGELLWRTPHPVASGTPLTTHVILEETRFFTRISLRVTADRGISAMSPSMMGQAHPPFLPVLSRATELSFNGLGVAPRPLERVDIADFVEGTLLSSVRRIPVVVVAPLEEGGYAVPLETLADEFLGLAHLYHVERHQDTFALSDAIGDSRLSAYWGAMRVYMPGFSRSDDPFDHPLLVRDAVSDPVLRAGRIGALGRQGVQRFRMPARVRDRRDARESDAREAARGASEPGPAQAEGTRGSASAHATGGADPEAGRESEAAPSGTSAAEPPASAPSASVPKEDTPAISREQEETGPDQTTVGGVPAETSPPAEFRDLRDRLGALIDAIRELVEGQRHVAEEITRLRTITAVRSAGNSSLERRMVRLEELLSKHLEPPLEESEVMSFQPAPQGELQDEDDAVTLLSVLRGAQERHPQTLLLLDSAMKSAEDSPYDDPEQVGVILDAMALVATRRASGSLGMSVKDAFRDLGVEYRGHIAKSTSDRLRQQYFFHGPDGREYDCVEHIVLGTSYDPKRCLRIYFTSRAPQETRLVIGHVGRHFEVKSTT